jgi:type I restriction enzyme S subunit
MSVWESKTISEIAEKIAMGPFGSNIKVSTFVDEGVPIISGQHLHGTRLDESSGFKFITQEHSERLKNSNVFPGDIIFTHAGTIGQVALIPEKASYDRYVISQRQFYLRVDRSRVDPSFITRWFHSPTGRHRLLMHASQVGVPSISRPASNLKEIKIPLPTLKEQKAISGVLDILDDKIELSRHTAETLEEMARTLYRSWFVDFDPIKAKVDGVAPAFMDEATATLFPDRFTDDGLPEGWGRHLTSDVVSFTKGRSYKTQELQPSKAALISLKSFKRGGGYRPDGLKSYNGIYKEDQVVRQGDIVISLTDVTQAAELIGRATYARPSSNFETLIASLDVGILRPRNQNRTPQEFLHQVFNSREFLDHALAHTNGTTVLHLAKDAIPSFLMLLPEQSVLEAFANIVDPMRDRIFKLENEIKTIASLRDMLLPRLMSGEIRITEAHERIKEVI